jgi:ABC-type nickel/cobalt efflux system permease component RcnA
MASAQVGIKALWTGILAAPLAWSAQELLSYGLVERLCRERETGAALRLAAGSAPVFLLISAATLAIALAGAWLAWRNWRKLRDIRRDSNLSPREIHAERSRFMARVALICNAGALCAFAFSISTLLVAPLCPG